MTAVGNELALRYFDDGRFPIVVARVPSGEAAEVDIPAFYAEWDAILARGPQGILLDLRNVNPVFVGGRERRAVADEADRRREAFQTNLKAEARVCSGPLVRAIMTAFDWMVGSPFGHPIANFEDEETAVAWIRERLLESPVGPRT